MFDMMSGIRCREGCAPAWWHTGRHNVTYISCAAQNVRLALSGSAHGGGHVPAGMDSEANAAAASADLRAALGYMVCLGMCVCQRVYVSMYFACGYYSGCVCVASVCGHRF